MMCYEDFHNWELRNHLDLDAPCECGAKKWRESTLGRLEVIRQVARMEERKRCLNAIRKEERRIAKQAKKYAGDPLEEQAALRRRATCKLIRHMIESGEE